jgi:hypothetical protein
LDDLCSRVIALDAGRIALDGEASAVLADPGLSALGVESPARYRIAAAVDAAGLRLPKPIP